MNTIPQPKLPAEADQLLKKALLYAYGLVIRRPARGLPAGLFDAWRLCLQKGTFQLGTPRDAEDVPALVYGVGSLRFLTGAGDNLEARQIAALLMESAFLRLLASLRPYRQLSNGQLLRELKARKQRLPRKQLYRDPLVQEIFRRHGRDKGFAASVVKDLMSRIEWPPN